VCFRKLGAKIELLSKEELGAKFPWLNTTGIEVGSHGKVNARVLTHAHANAHSHKHEHSPTQMGMPTHAVTHTFPSWQHLPCIKTPDGANRNYHIFKMMI
jgi:hypothetical protein